MYFRFESRPQSKNYDQDVHREMEHDAHVISVQSLKMHLSLEFCVSSICKIQMEDKQHMG